MKGYLYILQSELNNRYYIGSSNDIKRRLREHVEGKSKYTRLTRPFKLVFKQEYENLKQARRAERWLKKQKDKVLVRKLIRQGKPIKEF